MPRCDFDHAAKARYGIKHILAFGFLAEPVVQHGNKIGLEHMISSSGPFADTLARVRAVSSSRFAHARVKPDADMAIGFRGIGLRDDEAELLEGITQLAVER